MLSKNQILQSADLPHEDVDVPEWGGVVRVRTMSAADRGRYESNMFTVEKTGKGWETKPRFDNNTKLALVALCVVDEQGARLFSDEDLPALGAKNASAVDRLYQVARRLNGMGIEAEETLGNG